MNSHALDMLDGKSTLRQRQCQSDDAAPPKDNMEESSRTLDYKDNPEEDRKDLIEGPKTFGRTPDGTGGFEQHLLDPQRYNHILMW